MRIVALAACAAVSIGAASPGLAETSSPLLLSPHIRLGETFTWALTIRNGISSVSNPSRIVFDKGRTDVFTCTAVTQEDDAFVMTRRVKVMLRPSPKNAATTPPQVTSAMKSLGFDTSGKTVFLLPKPSFIEERGVDLSTEWRPLNADPICGFYSIAMYGAPPVRIGVATEWRFTRAWTTSDCPTCFGTTTVTAIDSVRKMVSLRVEEFESKSDAHPSVTMLSVGSGGIITSLTHTKNDPGHAVTLPDGRQVPALPMHERDELTLLSAGT